MHPLFTLRPADERRRDLLASRRRARAQAPPGTRRVRAAALAALLPVAVVAALPASAGAVTVSGAAGTVFVTGGGEDNRVVVRPAGPGRVLISDTAGETGTAPGCRVFNGDLDCPATQLQLVTGDGRDRVDYRAAQGGIVHLGEGNDTMMAGVRDRSAGAFADVTYAGGPGYDVVDYSLADEGVSVDMADRRAADGRAGDRENVIEDFEFLYGSQHRDVLLGTPSADGIAGLGDRDVIAGGAGNDVFYSAFRDGADDYHGGPGTDTIEYAGRTQPLRVTLDNITNDGEAGEFDLVRSNVENVHGGEGADTLNSFSAFSRLEGRGGADTLIGGAGPDTLIGGAGGDTIDAGAGADVVEAQDGQADAVDCGLDRDTLTRDATEGVVKGCESARVGVLRLGSRSVVARDGRATVTVAWAHPRSWRALRSVTVRVLDRGVAVGSVTIRPHARRAQAEGIASLARHGARISTRGGTVTARLALRIERTAARRLGVEVEAVDRAGRRQLAPRAGSISMR